LAKGENLCCPLTFLDNPLLAILSATVMLGGFYRTDLAIQGPVPLRSVIIENSVRFEVKLALLCQHNRAHFDTSRLFVNKNEFAEHI